MSKKLLAAVAIFLSFAVAGAATAQVVNGGVNNLLIKLSGTTIVPAKSTWTFAASAESAAGASSTVQYNKNGALGGSPNFAFTGSAVGVGSSTPFAVLSAAAASTSVLQALFAVASTSNNGATTTLFEINNVGDVITKGTAPTLGTCGTASVSATSTDMRGVIRVTGGTPTLCNIIFSSPKSDSPICLTGDNSLTIGADVVAASTTGVQFGIGAAFSGEIRYLCLQ